MNRTLISSILLLIGCATNTINNIPVPAHKIKVWGLNNPLVIIQTTRVTDSDDNFLKFTRSHVNQGKGVMCDYIIRAVIDKKTSNIVYRLNLRFGWQDYVDWNKVKYFNEEGELITQEVIVTYTDINCDSDGCMVLEAATMLLDEPALATWLEFGVKLRFSGLKMITDVELNTDRILALFNQVNEVQKLLNSSQIHRDVED